jgi:glycosyltransferase involved in cell wall biosynthesis
VKLIVQIPCLNEADTLADSLSGLPEAIEGIDIIETMVIDDGSEDDTAAVAEALGVNHVYRHTRNLGLAQAFATGIESCLALGADIIVNTDGDNQYPAESIPKLVDPVLRGRADIVILGSWLVRTVSGTEVADAPSGFRAYSREAALRLNVLTRYSYTLDTIIQAGKLGLRIESVPVATNPPTRPSRLQNSAWHFMKSQASTIIRLYAFYEPLRTFSYIAAPFIAAGIILLVRFGIFYLIGVRGIGRFTQSVTIGIGLLLVGVIIALFGLQADIASKHRMLTQDVLYRLKKLDLENWNNKDKSDRSNVDLVREPEKSRSAPDEVLKE